MKLDAHLGSTAGCEADIGEHDLSRGDHTVALTSPRS
jgi:hypothetical protein